MKQETKNTKHCKMYLCSAAYFFVAQSIGNFNQTNLKKKKKKKKKKKESSLTRSHILKLCNWPSRKIPLKIAELMGKLFISLEFTFFMAIDS